MNDTCDIVNYQNNPTDFLLNVKSFFLCSPCASLIGCFIIGLSAILPVFYTSRVVALELLQVLLSVSFGGLLTDVVLHLLPKAAGCCECANNSSLHTGLWIMTSILILTTFEDILVDCSVGGKKDALPKHHKDEIVGDIDCSEDLCDSCDIEEIPNGSFYYRQPCLDKLDTELIGDQCEFGDFDLFKDDDAYEYCNN